MHLVLSLVLWITNASAATPVRIALMSDTHTTFAPQGQTYKANLEKVISEINAANVSAVIVAGDLTDDGDEKEWKEFRAEIAKFKPPLFWVPGNHDVGHKL